MKILLSGCNGRMGQAISRKLSEADSIVAGVSQSGDKNNYQYPVYTDFNMVKESYDVIIDFSVAANAGTVIAYADAVKKPLVIGTTALSEKDESALTELSKKVAVLYAHNTSFGVTVLLQLLEVASQLLSSDYDIELIEKHDKNKLDAPSGTSHLLIEAIEEGAKKNYKKVYGRSPKSGVRKENEIGIHSVRGGHLASEHAISFIGDDETIEINHRAQSFDIYAVGAIKGGHALILKKSGLYSMKDFLNLTL